MSYVVLGYSDLALASLLIMISGGLSLAFRLGIERQLVLSAARMCIQLGAIGFVLKFIFQQSSPLWTGGLALIMILLAGREVFARQTNVLTGFWTYGLGTSTMMFAATSVMLVALAGLIRPDPLYAPRYVLPLLGMLLGNTMNGISLGLDTLTRTAKRERLAIEARIALGQSRADALREPVRDALRTGSMPIVNAMAASGIVSLPGMMTGQILAGVEPVEAVKYQILIMFLIAGATGLGVLMAVLGTAWRLTDERHRLRLDRLRAV